MIGETRKPALGDVTLVAVTSVAVEATVEALRKSMEQADFGRVLLLSDQQPDSAMGSIERIPIEPLRSRGDYSRFMLHDLWRYVTTEHALCVQWDGFVINGSAWRHEFTEYDYIGAVWPQFSDQHRVGNGGFSLRSRKLLEACRDLAFDDRLAEDLVIGRLHRTALERKGLRFASEDVAAQFAYERTSPTGREFGFHGAFNLVRHVPRKEAVAVFASLEPSLLTDGERREVFSWALLRGRFRLAQALLRKRG